MEEATHYQLLDKQINYFLLHKYLRGYVVNKGELLFERLGKYGNNLLVIKHELLKDHDPDDQFTEDLMNEELIVPEIQYLEFPNLKAVKFYVLRYYIENNLYD